MASARRPKKAAKKGSRKAARKVEARKTAKREATRMAQGGSAKKRGGARKRGRVRHTKFVHNRVAVVFDWDNTLAPDTYDALVESFGLDAQRFRKERYEPLVADGWEEILARCFTIIKESQARDHFVTREYLEAVGRGQKVFPGVPELFEHLRRRAGEIIDDIEVEFYVVSSGFIDLMRGASCADQFDGMWGTEFAFGEHGGVEFVRQVVTHPEKVRYILALAKGLDVGGSNEPEDAYRRVPEEDVHVPVSQIVYVGDGGSDIPAFTFVEGEGGLAIGVFPPGTSPETWAGWSAMDEQREEERVENLAEADYREGSELVRSLTLALESICKRVALGRLGAHD